MAEKKVTHQTQDPKQQNPNGPKSKLDPIKTTATILGKPK
jgi:hypothetical protein